MHFVSTLFDSMGTLAASNVQSDNPLNFEALNQVEQTKSMKTGTRQIDGRDQLYVNQMPFFRVLAWLSTRLSCLTTPSLIQCFWASRDSETGVMSFWITGVNAPDYRCQYTWLRWNFQHGDFLWRPEGVLSREQAVFSMPLQVMMRMMMIYLIYRVCPSPVQYQNENRTRSQREAFLDGQFHGIERWSSECPAKETSCINISFSV